MSAKNLGREKRLTRHAIYHIVEYQIFSFSKQEGDTVLIAVAPV